MEAWILTCLGLMILPGPDMALVTRYALAGRAWPALGGIYLSFAIYSLLLLLGILALLQKWPEWSDWARIVGGAYLLWLAGSGLWKLQQREESLAADQSLSGSPFWAGFWSNALNAKQYLFLFLLLPGFLPPSSTWINTLSLLLVMFFVSLLFWIVWIRGISWIASRYEKHIVVIEKMSLLGLAGVGVLLLLGII